MTNFEKYDYKIIKYITQWCDIKALRDGECSSNCKKCKEESEKWLLSEYEPPVDWSKVPVDTKILVSDDGTIWVKRHFAKYEFSKYETGGVFAWRGGETSWSAGKYGDVKSWQYAKLAEDGES